jgi:metal-responsive CopG/Arc/MetJ family transcriptional regulator
MTKFVISIPDDLFERAQRLARQTRKSRSRLFIDALKEYMATRTPDYVTEEMNSALAEVGEIDDRFVSTSARRILERSEW